MRRYFRKWIPGTKYTRAGWYILRQYDEEEPEIIDGPFTEEEVNRNLDVLGDCL